MQMKLLRVMRGKTCLVIKVINLVTAYGVSNCRLGKSMTKSPLDLKLRLINVR